MLSRCNFYAISKLVVARSPFPCSACMYMNGIGRPRKPHRYGGSDRPAERLGTPLPRYYDSAKQLPSSPQTPIDNEDKSQNIFQRFKTMAKKYWYIVLPVHLITSTVWFGSFYFIASSGVDVPSLLNLLGCPDWIIDKVRNGNSWTSYLVIAYGLYKIFTPFRYMVTLGGTSMTIRYIQKLGYINRNPSSPKKPS